ncbi:hypothetical protein GCM10029978_029750 [Actinoallomurus acanthiterrae]
MELRQLRTFLAVAVEGTVTDAAIAVELAPSSVSEQVRALERSLGVALFDRTPEGMRLTEAGRRMTVWARRLLDQADQARREVTGRPSYGSGPWRRWPPRWSPASSPGSRPAGRTWASRSRH